MFKKVLSTTVLSASLLATMTANAAVPGVYVTGQIGYANTHMGNKINNTDILNYDVDPAKLGKNLSNNGLAGRTAIGYQFNQNFAVEAGYLHLSKSKIDLGAINSIVKSGADSQGTLKLQQNVIDIAGKGIIPLNNTINVYGKLGVAYLTTNIKATLQTPGEANVTVNLNDSANIVKHSWAPEAAIGISYGITPNVSLDASLTHIQPLGNNRPGTIDFAAVGFGYNFG